jgi:hypothetical protein
MKDPNNVRNRWRRMKESRDAYGFYTCKFRDIARYLSENKNYYSAEPHNRNYNVLIGVRK